MSTFRIGNPRRSSLLWILSLLGTAAILIPACKDSNDITGTTNPPPVMNVAGAWSGTFTPSEPAFYYSEPVTASANLQQTGTTVQGTITISGVPTPVVITATVSGNHVNGTIADGNGPGTEVGTLAAGRLTFILRSRASSGTGTVSLHR